MRFSILAATLYASALPGIAQATIGPPIGYGAANTIYLVNPDGTGLTAVYRAPKKAILTSFDLHPGGGEVALIENKKLKVLQYDERGVATGPARSISIPCAVILEADYGPDGALAVKDGCAPNHLWRVAPGASAADPSPLLTDPDTLDDVKWSRDGSRIYYDALDGIRALDVATKTSSVVYPESHTMWDVTDSGDRLILASTNFNYFVHDFSSNADTNGCTQAYVVHYGNNDAQMVYRSPASHGGGSYILLTNSDCSGAPFRITGKAGAYLGPDWAAP